jgi:hypothetical protein
VSPVTEDDVPETDKLLYPETKEGVELAEVMLTSSNARLPAFFEYVNRN